MYGLEKIMPQQNQIFFKKNMTTLNEMFKNKMHSNFPIDL